MEVRNKFNILEWIATDLTRDHKPSEKDESLRIRSHGGRIEPMKEDDQFQGPDRVWLAHSRIPGLAMSRAFGDKVAATVGVISSPGNKD